MNYRTFVVSACALLAVVSGANAQSLADAEARLATADAQYRNARQEEAIGSYQQAADEFQRLGNAGKFVYSYNQIGVILTRQDKYEQARTYLDKALAAGLASLGPDDLTVASTYLALGVVYSAEGQFDRSLEVHDKALGIRLKKLGKFDANVATSYGNIANVHFRKKDYDQAIAAHAVAMEIREKVFGADGPEIVESYRGLGNAWREKKDYAQALGYFERALRNKIAQLGSGHRDLGRYYMQISEVHALAGNLAKAGEYSAKAQEVEKPLG
jgi:tetratricopeptide (TPR) repeat protein